MRAVCSSARSLCRAPRRGARRFGGLGMGVPASKVPLDVAVVGGGIIGCGVAREVLERHPNLRVGVLEKEATLGSHQTRNNSGVIHAGMYYKPGSLKARFCVEGAARMYAYCERRGVPHRRAGKLIVAVEDEERGRLRDIYERGVENGVPGLEIVGPDAIREIEPSARGVEAIWSPNTGIVDFQAVCESYAEDVRRAGGSCEFGFKVVRIERAGCGDQAHSSSDSVGGLHRVVAADGRTVLARRVITAGGLHADALAHMGGGSPSPAVVPFRGTWLLVKPEYKDMVKTNIYPVPNPKLPFLGVHITPTMRGELLLGPNAILATKREGYTYADFNLRETAAALAQPGLWKLVCRHFAQGVGEVYRDWVLSASVAELRRYVPALTRDHIDGRTSGVRAIALDNDGIMDEFAIEDVGDGVMHVRNAPSPACTASLRIAEEVVTRAEKAGFFSREVGTTAV